MLSFNLSYYLSIWLSVHHCTLLAFSSSMNLSIMLQLSPYQISTSNREYLHVTVHCDPFPQDWYAVVLERPIHLGVPELVGTTHVS